jgi:glycosyltransferase involved in cell wall biosynthesis
MMILEAIAHGVPIVAWDVGGNAEFPGDIVRTVKNQDVSAFVEAVSSSVAHTAAPERFREVTDLINDDYLSGVKAVVDAKEYKSPFTRNVPARSIISRIRSYVFTDRTLQTP